MQRSYRHGDEVRSVTARVQADEVVLETAAGSSIWNWLQLSAGEYVLRRDGRQTRCVVAGDGNERWVWIDGHVHHLQVESGGRGASAAVSADRLTSPMPGLVLKVFVSPGDAVEARQVLVVLEAMKMQYEITAPRAGVIAQVPVAEGADDKAGRKRRREKR